MLLRLQTLEQRHALDIEEAKLKAREETFALAAELAAAEVKAKVSKSSLKAQPISAPINSHARTGTSTAPNHRHLHAEPSVPN